MSFFIIITSVTNASITKISITITSIFITVVVSPKKHFILKEKLKKLGSKFG